MVATEPDTLVTWAERAKAEEESRKAFERGRADRLLAEHSGFLWQQANRWAARNPDADPDDLYSAAVCGLLHAARKYDPDAGVKFLTYAGYWVTNYVRECVRKAASRGFTGLNRDTIARPVLGDLAGPDPEVGGDVPDRREAPGRAVPAGWWGAVTRHLHRDQRRVVLALYRDGRTTAEIAESMGCTRQWVHGLRDAAFERLKVARAALGRAGLLDIGEGCE